MIFINSKYGRETVLRIYNIDSKVCYLGIDTDYYKPAGEPKENFVVGPGSIYHAKGKFLDALVLVAKMGALVKTSLNAVFCVFTICKFNLQIV